MPKLVELTFQLGHFGILVVDGVFVGTELLLMLAFTTYGRIFQPSNNISFCVLSRERYKPLFTTPPHTKVYISVAGYMTIPLSTKTHRSLTFFVKRFLHIAGDLLRLGEFCFKTMVVRNERMDLSFRYHIATILKN